MISEGGTVLKKRAICRKERRLEGGRECLLSQNSCCKGLGKQEKKSWYIHCKYFSCTGYKIFLCLISNRRHCNLYKEIPAKLVIIIELFLQASIGVSCIDYSKSLYILSEIFPVYKKRLGSKHYQQQVFLLRDSQTLQSMLSSKQK